MTKLQKCKSLQVADDVLKELNLLLKEVPLKTESMFSIYCYSNGREQGYYIPSFVSWGSGCAFSENRNSDDIVVYIGRFDNHVPTDQTYRNGSYYKNSNEAAQGIYNFILDELLEDKYFMVPAKSKALLLTSNNPKLRALGEKQSLD